MRENRMGQEGMLAWCNYKGKCIITHVTYLVKISSQWMTLEPGYLSSIPQKQKIWIIDEINFFKRGKNLKVPLAMTSLSKACKHTTNLSLQSTRTHITKKISSLDIITGKHTTNLKKWNMVVLILLKAAEAHWANQFNNEGSWCKDLQNENLSPWHEILSKWGGRNSNYQTLPTSSISFKQINIGARGLNYKPLDLQTDTTDY